MMGWKREGNSVNDTTGLHVAKGSEYYIYNRYQNVGLLSNRSGKLGFNLQTILILSINRMISIKER